MQRALFLSFLTVLCGCGSCLEDKKAPDAEAAPVTPVYVSPAGDAGLRRRLDLRPGINIDVLKDASAERPNQGGGS